MTLLGMRALRQRNMDEDVKKMPDNARKQNLPNRLHQSQATRFDPY
jgi:hypothetical protein